MPKQPVPTPGDRFGYLTVLNSREPMTGHRAVLCRCVCGRDKAIRVDHLRSGKVTSCTCMRGARQPVGEASPSWKGGTRIEEGYRLVYRPGHSHAKSNGYVREHRLVMSEHLGRPLLPDENVHHVNGDKLDNRIENLELWSTSQPPGQRVQDKLAWAREMIERYET